MTEVEKQEGQKTVVAFITGLLIGGLLVWVFSSTPESKVKPEEKESTDTEQVANDEKKSDDTKTEATAVKEEIVIGKGSLEVTDQKAGDSVTLGKIEFPTKSGWVVVRDLKDGKGIGVLGAALYNTEIGLIPTTVPLMRATVKDSSYQVVFFTNNGDNGFLLAEDKPIEGPEATFKAN